MAMGTCELCDEYDELIDGLCQCCIEAQVEQDAEREYWEREYLEHEIDALREWEEYENALREGILPDEE